MSVQLYPVSRYYSIVEFIYSLIHNSCAVLSKYDEGSTVMVIDKIPKQ